LVATPKFFRQLPDSTGPSPAALSETEIDDYEKGNEKNVEQIPFRHSFDPPNLSGTCRFRPYAHPKGEPFGPQEPAPFPDNFVLNTLKPSFFPSLLQ
jgi:hypothetical protein